ncbi:Hypothetical predicted protein, partial [Pelobates cultripes]
FESDTLHAVRRPSMKFKETLCHQSMLTQLLLPSSGALYGVSPLCGRVRMEFVVAPQDS